jgi:hypothetical protein
MKIHNYLAILFLALNSTIIPSGAPAKDPVHSRNIQNSMTAALKAIKDKRRKEAERELLERLSLDELSLEETETPKAEEFKWKLRDPSEREEEAERFTHPLPVRRKQKSHKRCGKPKTDRFSCHRCPKIFATVTLRDKHFDEDHISKHSRASGIKGLNKSTKQKPFCTGCGYSHY